MTLYIKDGGSIIMGGGPNGNDRSTTTIEGTVLANGQIPFNKIKVSDNSSFIIEDNATVTLTEVTYMKSGSVQDGGKAKINVSGDLIFNTDSDNNGSQTYQSNGAQQGGELSVTETGLITVSERSVLSFNEA